MRRLTAWTVTSVLVLCFWIAMVLGTWGWVGQVAVGSLTALALLYGLIRLALYRPDFERGSGSLGELKRQSMLIPLDEPTAACSKDREKEDENEQGRTPQTG